MDAERCLLLKHGELFLKGKNRPYFQRRLHTNLRAALPPECGHVDLLARGSTTLAVPERETDALAARLAQIPGLSMIETAVRVAPSLEDLSAAALGELRRVFGEELRGCPRTFAISARRRDKSFPLNSMGISSRLGAEVQAATGWPVDLSRPAVEISIEVERHEAFVSVERTHGVNGLPVSTSGRALVLLSGGFDSPVAARRMMMRGLRCDFVHFSGAPFTDPSSTYKAYALARQLTRFQPESRLWVVPLGKAQRTLANSAPPALRTIAQRRLMVLIAEALAQDKAKFDALVMGDNLGQVASQTLSNIATVDEVATMPILRPLIGWNKNEIIAEADHIGTGDISILPDQDCCTLLAPPRPAVYSDPIDLSRVEKRADVDVLVESAVGQVEEYRFPEAAK